MKCIICKLEMEKFEDEDGWIKEVCPFHANVRSEYKEQLVDLIVIPEYTKTPLYNFREPFGYIAVGSSQQNKEDVNTFSSEH